MLCVVLCRIYLFGSWVGELVERQFDVRFSGRSESIYNGVEDKMVVNFTIIQTFKTPIRYPGRELISTHRDPGFRYLYDPNYHQLKC